MYATLVFGLALLAVAVRYALRPAGRFIPLLASLGITTLASGTLGFVSGVIKTTHALPELAERADVVVWLGLVSRSTISRSLCSSASSSRRWRWRWRWR